MDIHNLVRMANQIGSFYESYPDPVEAASEIASHLRKFWAPRMRSQMLAYVDNQNGEGLHEAVLAAIKLHRQKLTPQGDPIAG